jgi:CDP-diacylglycerol--glycerol-3-phosphate 3-phosphatidyltransferase
VRTLPNALAIARAVAVVPVIALLATPALAAWALAVFSVASLTDAVDGPIARRLRAATPLGAFLDPLADKVLVLGTLAALLVHGAVPAWAVVLILGRDAIVTALRGVAATRGIAIPASGSGKAKTVLQFVAVAGLILTVAMPGAEIEAAAVVVLSAAILLTIASGVDVVVRAAALLLPTPAAERLRVDAR